MENHWFWEVEEHHAGVLDTSGPAKLCWHMVLWLQDRSRASKPVLVQVLGHQGHQTLRWCIENPKPHFWRRENDKSSKPVLVQVLGHQGHQTLRWCVENPKPHFWRREHDKSSKLVLVQVRWHQGHQTLCWCIENPKPHFWRRENDKLDPRATLNEEQITTIATL